MATKADFTEAEWTTLERGVTGSSVLVSLADRDFTDTFGEVSAMTHYLAGQQVAASSELIRQLAKVHGTGFGLTSSPEKVRAETLDALKGSIATLTAKSPDDVEPYRQLVIGTATAVAEAKSGVKPTEASVLAAIRDALGAS
jgi:hypothetical protein